jgi:hypothetical protein
VVLRSPEASPDSLAGTPFSRTGSRLAATTRRTTSSTPRPGGPTWRRSSGRRTGRSARKCRASSCPSGSPLRVAPSRRRVVAA